MLLVLVNMQVLKVTYTFSNKVLCLKAVVWNASSCKHAVRCAHVNKVLAVAGHGCVTIHTINRRVSVRLFTLMSNLNSHMHTTSKSTEHMCITA